MLDGSRSEVKDLPISSANTDGDASSAATPAAIPTSIALAAEPSWSLRWRPSRPRRRRPGGDSDHWRRSRCARRCEPTRRGEDMAIDPPTTGYPDCCIMLEFAPTGAPRIVHGRGSVVVTRG
ncbi:MAG: hypothetical protein KBG48_30675 [Kofleriaceae bacterium]|jgi:hypothetical protein|nr:hypothetical protein [Kofleriaceae bacterium]MBP9171797.1 hypothetical protein [Kofleriaceae bacterium]MBP9861332.1 hypothetical protein [Kofleriaceae bacterium]